MSLPLLRLLVSFCGFTIDSHPGGRLKATERPANACGQKKGQAFTCPLESAAVSAYTFSHFWLATVQEVLQADWQEVWHSPQPPLAALAFRVAPLRV